MNIKSQSWTIRHTTNENIAITSEQTEENKAFGELSFYSELSKLISEATVHKKKVSFKNILFTVLNCYISSPPPV